MSDWLNGSRRIRALTSLALALAIFGLMATVASATTVGGLATFSSGPFALAGPRLFVPMFSTSNLGEASPGPPVTEMTTDLQSFAAGKRGERTLTLDASTLGSAPPALAVSGSRTAVTWVGAHGFQSALVTANGAHVSSPVTIPASGPVEGYVASIDSTGARAVLWLDTLGIRLQTVSAAGVAALPLTLASGKSSYYSLSSDDTDGWWAVWIVATRVVAIHIGADGTASAPIDLAAAPKRAIAARLLHLRPWTAVADGSGGLWVGFLSGLVRVTPGGVSERRAGGGLALAQGDRATTLAESRSAHTIVLRPLGRSGRTLRLHGLGSLLDIAYDPARRTTDLLTAVGRGRVELTSVNGRGRVSSTLVRGCPRAGSGELTAAGGIAGIACASRSFEAESVETGGDFEAGRHVHYYLLRNGRRLQGESFFEGEHDY